LRYLAGVWDDSLSTEDLPRICPLADASPDPGKFDVLLASLSWRVSGGWAKRPVNRKVPSWSWAAVDGEIKFDLVPLLGDVHTAGGYICKPSPVFLDDDSYTQAAGKLELEGPVVDAGMESAFLQSSVIFWDYVAPPPDPGCIVSPSGDAVNVQEPLKLMIVYKAPAELEEYISGGAGLILKEMEDGNFIRRGWFQIDAGSLVSEFMAVATRRRITIV